MNRDIPKFITREVLVPILLTLLTVAAGKIANSLGDISDQIVDLRIHLATITQKVVEHERRIGTLETQ